MLWLLSLFGQVQGNLPELSGEDKQECTHVIFREYPECDPTASTPAPNPSEAATMSLRQFTKHLTFGSMQCFQMRTLRFRLKSIDHKHTGRGRAEMCTLTALIPRRRISPLAEHTRYLCLIPSSLLTCVKHSHQKFLLLPDPLLTLTHLASAHASARISPSHFSTHSLTSWVIVTGGILNHLFTKF